MIHTLSFKKKILLLVVAAVVAVVTLSILSTVAITRHINEGRRAQLTAVVESAHAIVDSFRAQAQAGKMSDEAAQAAAKAALRGARYGAGNSDYFYIFQLDGVSVMHPIKSDWEGQPMVGKVKDANGGDVFGQMVQAMKAASDGRAFLATSFPRPGQTEPSPKLQYMMKVDGWNWMVGSGVYVDDVQAAVRSAVVQSGLAVLLVLGVLGAIGWAVGRSVLNQIGGEPAEATEVMAQVAEGNLAVTLPRAVPGSLLDALVHMVSSLRETVTQVRQSTESIAVAAREIATGNTDLSARTEQTASNLQQTASSMEELTSTVRQSADAATTANQLASSAAGVAEEGGRVVSDVVRTMDEINQSSQRIADIIGVIDGIAFQTNILALNAAVEAARAGEQGRGFAVVAGEVRSLAQRSAEAAKEIKTLIGASVEKVEGGARLVGHAGTTMEQIVSSVRRVTDVVGEITAAAAEQSQGIGEVNTAVTTLDQMTQQNAALVEQSAAAAESLREQSARLAQVVSRFRLGHEVAEAPRSASPAPVAAKPAKSAASRAPVAARPAPAPRAPARPAVPRAATPASSAPAAPAAVEDGDWATF